ncbi:hypothetical protein RRG08_014371 [Elysia crispata]|uniref:Uncharacterized protein n=1 Tax=Elysia crispata TaxID=231223 RepID=A0AAE1D1V8_9GAST|nr:hypothetical protein RRG08_014371 [Elysia crispata]
MCDDVPSSLAVGRALECCRSFFPRYRHSKNELKTHVIHNGQPGPVAKPGQSCNVEVKKNEEDKEKRLLELQIVQQVFLAGAGSLIEFVGSTGYTVWSWVAVSQVYRTRHECRTDLRDFCAFVASSIHSSAATGHDWLGKSP